jgi:peptidoglycan-N-acetylglucosamine deacetylase
MTPRTKPVASLSLDLDNHWSYLKTHGDESWREFPSYLDVMVPRALDLLEKYNLKITFFVVGQDAALSRNHSALKEIAEAGHEIGNHSYRHEPWLHAYARDEIEAELENAERAIIAATGTRPRGFRGPGYSFSASLLQTLELRNYLYDASTFPTFIGPFARAYYFFSAMLSADQKQERKKLFGGLRDAIRPLKPYHWDLGGRRLLEIPVTTTPILRTPFHLSYILYLAGWSSPLAHAYFRTALQLCLMTGVQPSLLLHPLDFLGRDDVKNLEFFPAMQLNSRTKLELVDRALETYSTLFRVVPLMEHAEILNASQELRRVIPRASLGGGAYSPRPVARHTDTPEAA